MLKTLTICNIVTRLKTLLRSLTDINCTTCTYLNTVHVRVYKMYSSSCRYDCIVCTLYSKHCTGIYTPQAVLVKYMKNYKASMLCSHLIYLLYRIIETRSQLFILVALYANTGTASPLFYIITHSESIDRLYD